MKDLGAFMKSELSDYRPDLDLNEEIFLEKINKKSRFKQFSVYEFNIYYALAIVSGFLITISCAIHYVYMQSVLFNNDNGIRPHIIHNETVHKNDINKSNIDSTQINISKIPLINRKNILKSNKERELNVKNNTIINVEKKEILCVPEELIINLPFQLNKDTMSVNKTIRKKVLIFKRDTIIKTDTFKIRKKAD